MIQGIDTPSKIVYESIKDLTVNERKVIQEVRALESGHVIACIDKGCITHIKIEQTKKL